MTESLDILGAIFACAPESATHIAVDAEGLAAFYRGPPRLDYQHRCWEGPTVKGDMKLPVWPPEFSRENWKRMCWKRGM